MLKDTPQGQTNHCLMCEDAAKRIEELERQNAMLIEYLETISLASSDYKSGTKAGLEAVHKLAREAVKATSAQSSAWLNKKHVEWMKNLPVAAFGSEVMARDGHTPPVAYVNGYPKDGQILVAIPSDKD